VKAILLALLLALPLLAGCSGKEAGPDAAADLVDVGGVLVAADKAVVGGRVVSDAGLAVPRARVSVLGTDTFTDADERGAFLLVNVTAGSVELQATHPSYKAHIHRLDAAAGRRVDVNLTLLPLDSAGVELPHLHDHWGGQDTYVLLDAEVDLGKGPTGSPYPDEYWTAYSALYRGNMNVSNWEVPIEETPHGGPALVLPGTASITFTVTWDEAVTEGFGICYDSANKDPVRCLAPQPSPATFTLAVSPTMADSGHQSFSLWRLMLYTRGLTQPGGGNPDVIVGSAAVQAVLTKGEVLVDPPHPTFWANGDEVVFMDEERPGSSACCSQPADINTDGIVPPGTTRVRVEHTWRIEGAASQLPWEFRIVVRTAAMNPHTTPRTEWLMPEPTEGSAAEMRLVYEFPIDASATDGYYQSSSFWRFAYFQPRWGPQGYDLAGVPIQHRMVATAIREA
jgi:hypothetical protein